MSSTQLAIESASSAVTYEHYEAEERAVELATGTLHVRVDRSEYALDQLCGFASRRNPKRGFLFVSKVLGKHIPVKPRLMRSVHTCLAEKISADLPGPIVFIGMAETAIQFGHGVYDEYVRRTGREDVLFIQSTRYRLNRPCALEFAEEHSHAVDHLIYLPENPADRLLFENARTIVLVDDEASTGKTFVNLARAFKNRIPSLWRIVTAVITDWRGKERTKQTVDAMPVPSETVSVLEGMYSFAPHPNLQAVVMPKVTGNGAFKDDLLRHNYGRFGVRGASSPLSFRETDMRSVDRFAHTLVLGTGEFTYPPFLYAEAMERRGYDVFYQSTTRSPIMEGGAIACTLNFADNYGDGIANFVYNVRRSDYDSVIVCHETPTSTLDPKMLAELKPVTLEF